MDAGFLSSYFPDFVRSVRGLSPEGFWFILFLLVAAGAAAFYFIWRSLHRARLIEDMPTARIRSAAQGYQELEGEGRLLDGPPIVGPLTGTQCLWYRYRIERREAQRGRGQGSTWSTLQSGVSDGLFLLEDETGRCIIDPDGAEVIADVCDTWYGHEEFPSQGPSSRGWLHPGGGDYRYTEERLMPGVLYALGWFGTLRNPAGDVQAEVSLMLRDWKADQIGLLSRFDRNGDGRIDAGEWDAAREAALQEVIHLRRHRPYAADSNVLSCPPSDRHPFLLSALPQDVLTGRYRRRAGMALAATLLGVIAIVLFVSARL